jgi:hypothetical protein
MNQASRIAWKGQFKTFIAGGTMMEYVKNLIQSAGFRGYQGM